MADRGWAPDDGDNEGLDARKGETDRLNAESNAQQQAASQPKPATEADTTAAPDIPTTDAPPPR